MGKAKGASAVRVALLRVLFEPDELTAAGFLVERRAPHPRGVGAIFWRADRGWIAAELWRIIGDLFGYGPSAGAV